MAKNIKEIGKELMGKSLNSFHRKTGLTQLEENNKMQDGILDGILSQVDDVYIEKTEQSNVIHLDGSGDGVVVVDSIEGNTMVNLFSKITSLSQVVNFNVDTTLSDGWLTVTTNKDFATVATSIYASKNFDNIKTNTKYTLVFNYSCVNNVSSDNNVRIYNDVTNSGIASIVTKTSGIYKLVFTTPETIDKSKFRIICYGNGVTGSAFKIGDFILLEGDYTDKEINYFEGLQSSFEEKVNDEGKYEIEILMKNKNLFDGEMEDGAYSSSGVEITHPTFRNKNKFILVEPNTKYNLQCINSGEKPVIHEYDENKTFIRYGHDISRHGTHERTKYINFRTQTNTLDYKFQLEKGDVLSEYIPHKTNKIKLLLNSPLLKGDKLEVKDGKLYHVKSRKLDLFDGSNMDNIGIFNNELTTKDPIITFRYDVENLVKGNSTDVMCNLLPANINSLHQRNEVGIGSIHDSRGLKQIRFAFNKSTLGITESLINSTKYIQNLQEYLVKNNMKIVYLLEEPIYEEVLNEYGEPILLEGYENGTIYIDSTIVPATTVRYTPKMESFKTLKEVENNNIMLTNDVNDNIIPYMMDVDLMIMEKEMALMSQYKIRRIGAKDMTSMQKRTQDMLTRLIKGKTLTEQECKTRVVTYLDAGKITDAQADELMLLISEVYA